jgi:uncharacterized OB-fold protein
MSQIIEEFRAGLAAGELRIQHCNGCDKSIMYPRYRCPFCHGEDLRFIRASGEGVLHSYTVVRVVPPRGFEDDLPYALGVVKLAEGVQLLGRLHPCSDGSWAGYRCDVRVTFRGVSAQQIEARPVAWFGLAE